MWRVTVPWVLHTTLTQSNPTCSRSREGVGGTAQHLASPLVTTKCSSCFLRQSRSSRFSAHKGKILFSEKNSSINVEGIRNTKFAIPKKITALVKDHGSLTDAELTHWHWLGRTFPKCQVVPVTTCSLARKAKKRKHLHSAVTQP